MIIKILLLSTLAVLCQGRPDASVATNGYCFASGGDGRCVPYYLCKGNLLITEPSADIDFREPEPPSPCANFIDVCCQKGRILDKKP